MCMNGNKAAKGERPANHNRPFLNGEGGSKPPHPYRIDRALQLIFMTAKNEI